MAGYTDYKEILRDHCLNHRVGTYVEIGVGWGDSLAALLDCAQPPSNIVAIDPSIKKLRSSVKNRVNVHLLTSDDFFKQDDLTKDLKIDMAFIDGMHLFEYALRDFINCEKYAQKDAAIFFHDVLPRSPRTVSRDMAAVPYWRLFRAWNGDIWKIVPVLKKFRPDLTLKVHSVRDGLLEVSGLDPNSTVLAKEYDRIFREYENMSYVDYTRENGIPAGRETVLGGLLELLHLKKR